MRGGDDGATPGLDCDRGDGLRDVLCAPAPARPSVGVKPLLLLGVGAVFASGCLGGAWLVRSDVETAARTNITRFAAEVSVLAGRVETLEAVCR